MKLAKRTDLFVMMFVLGIIVMIVIPIPKPLLSMLIIVNIFVSMTILLVAMSTKEPLDFSVFPSMLLITTLFRLTLNISSTRLILGQADAGSVIKAFGDFVISNNAVVGFMVFLIIIIVQFIVITRGAERVAEVAARFTLDAMPGKQIAIDADMNAGLITEEEARKRRQTIEREADFYGAMDGASKFVKGDAIASMLIVGINIVAGFIIGIAMHHMPFQQALSTYTLLSVGDGLVSQIPALLLSTATGLMVSRAASEDNLGTDVVSQVFGYPRALFIVAIVIFLLGVVTPIGILPVLPVSAAAAIGGWRLQQKKKQSQVKQVEEAARSQQAETKKPENVFNLLTVEPIEFEFGYGLIPLVDSKQGGDLLERVVMIRRQLAIELGLVIPMVRMRDNIQLKPTQYAIKLKGVQVAEGEIVMGHWLALSPGVENPAIQGVKTKDPAFGLPAIWVNQGMRVQAEANGYTVVDPPSVIATHLTEVLRRHAHELLGRQETKSLLDHVKTTNPAAVDDVYPNPLSLGQIQNVLSNLLREKISIRDMVTILETLADAARQTQDPDVLTEQVRQALARQICNQFSVPGEPMAVITLSATIEEQIQQSLVERPGGAFIGMDPAQTQRVIARLQEESGKLQAVGKTPVLLVHPQLRLPVRRWIERYLPDVVVLSYNELDPTVEIQSGGVVNL
ncbi:flagellar biosynthesis protein FlhA [Alicyclobacillus acidoterrestris]|uniref:flagellar biosynthesis protein FlhA n=1 Tax=Alicyclobacillus suci TaxID=2816080 RepID=UPI001196C801|nr:flagellar biosynthesis protein FlhA [Alicyclobacillus suci]GEO24826.1 flagellar biosynthesis protein FlhA [Alicyclobacillus acidoterrestris]